MNNNRQSFITESNTFVDEFETSSTTVTMERNIASEPAISQEAQAFNSRISQNFQNIFNYGTTATASTQTVDYNGYATQIQNEYKPSATTMQFASETKNDIYKDYRASEADYAVDTKVRGSVKAVVAVFIAIVIALCALIVFNTTLLNNMNGLIAEKTAEVQELKSEVELKQIELESVSSDAVVQEKAKEYGMVEAE